MAWSKITTSFIVVFCVLLRETVSQVQMSVSPQVVVLGSSSPVSTTFTCTISGSASINDIFNMQILRKRKTDLDFFVVGQVKTREPNPAFVPNAPQDIVSRGSMSGGIDSGTLTSSTLTLTLSSQDVVCTDKGHYQCILVYQDTSSKTITVQSNETLSIYALPQEVSLTASKDNMNIQGSSVDNAAIVNVGEMVEFTCSARIGSDNTTRLRWKRTSESEIGNFIPYQQDDIDDGTPISMETDCSYTRTATLRYNVTLSDANPNYNLAFQCYVSVDPPGQGTVETQNPPTFYINAVNPNAPTNTGESKVANAGSDVGAIAGGVIGGLVGIVLIVLLVYFLWYRRRGDGSTYKTKEETGEQNPNIVSGAPVDQTYAVPNKERKRGHENRGLDERHTNRSRDDDYGYTRDNYDDINDDHIHNNNSRYSRDRGRANHALDHDDDNFSRDGSPTIKIMGLDPESGSYGTGV